MKTGSLIPPCGACGVAWHLHAVMGCSGWTAPKEVAWEARDPDEVVATALSILEELEEAGRYGAAASEVWDWAERLKTALFPIRLNRPDPQKEKDGD